MAKSVKKKDYAGTSSVMDSAPEEISTKVKEALSEDEAAFIVMIAKAVDDLAEAQEELREAEKKKKKAIALLESHPQHTWTGIKYEAWRETLPYQAFDTEGAKQKLGPIEVARLTSTKDRTTYKTRLKSPKT